MPLSLKGRSNGTVLVLALRLGPSILDWALGLERLPVGLGVAGPPAVTPLLLVVVAGLPVVLLLLLLVVLVVVVVVLLGAVVLGAALLLGVEAARLMGSSPILHPYQA